MARRVGTRVHPPASPLRSADPVLEFIRRIWSVDHELQRVSKRMVSRMGVTAPQRLAVRFIGQHSGLTLGTLAEFLHLHAGTVTGIVRRLEQLGLVEQTQSAEDMRRRHLTLTPKGQRFDRRRKGTVEAAVRRTTAAATRMELAAASRVMDRLASNLAAEQDAQSLDVLLHRMLVVDVPSLRLRQHARGQGPLPPAVSRMVI